MSKLDPERRRSIRREARSGLATVFFIVGSVLNLLALLLLLANTIGLLRLVLAGEPVALGLEHLTPLGAFLAGLLCYAIANWLDE